MTAGDAPESGGDQIERFIPTGALKGAAPTRPDALERMKQPVGRIDDFGGVRAARTTHTLGMVLERGNALDAACLQGNLYVAARRAHPAQAGHFLQLRGSAGGRLAGMELVKEPMARHEYTLYSTSLHHWLLFR
jgi:hypothetical protein